MLQAKHQPAQEFDRRLRDEFGVHVNHVSPVQSKRSASAAVERAGREH